MTGVSGVVLDLVDASSAPSLKAEMPVEIWPIEFDGRKINEAVGNLPVAVVGNCFEL